MMSCVKRLSLAVCFCLAVPELAALTGCGPNREFAVMVPSAVDLGVVSAEHSDEIVVDFEIHNATPQPLALRVGSVPCICTRIELGQDVVDPHDIGSVKLHLRRKGLYGKHAFTAQLLTDNLRYPVLEVRVTGDFAFNGLARPVVIDLGERHAGSPIDEMQSVSITGPVIQEIVALPTNPADIQVEVGSEGGSPVARIRGRVPRLQGMFEWKAAIDFGDKEPRGELIVRGVSVPGIRVPADVYFEPLEPGESGVLEFFAARRGLRGTPASSSDGQAPRVAWRAANQTISQVQVTRAADGWNVRVESLSSLASGDFHDLLTLELSWGNHTEVVAVPVHGLVLTP
jgi:hypothetical protein